MASPGLQDGMDNVLRPAFGGPAEPETPSPAAGEAYRPLRVYGTAAGYLVALIRYDDGPEGFALRIVVGPEDASTTEAVAIMPDTPEGEVDAEATAMAILRTIEIVAAGGGSTG